MSGWCYTQWIVNCCMSLLFTNAMAVCVVDSSSGFEGRYRTLGLQWSGPLERAGPVGVSPPKRGFKKKAMDSQIIPAFYFFRMEGRKGTRRSPRITASGLLAIYFVKLHLCFYCTLTNSSVLYFTELPLHILLVLLLLLLVLLLPPGRRASSGGGGGSGSSGDQRQAQPLHSVQAQSTS